MSHCEVAGDEGDGPESAISSEVHLDGSHTNILNGSAPAGSFVHDQVTLIVSGLDGDWNGTLTLNFYANKECDDDDNGLVDTADYAWNQDDDPTREDLLPQGPLAVGGYSYRESFDFIVPADTDLDVVGDCEPFEIVAEQTTRTTDPGTTPPGEHPPTGVSLTGLILAGVALVAGGTALVYFRRRRDATGTTL